MAKICVFTASSLPESTPADLINAMEDTARRLAELGHELVMGGMSSGSMNLIGSTYLKAGGRAMTIIYPEEYASWEESQEHPNLTHIRVPNLHQRLETMIATSDAFIAFPGGIGTIHEIAQVIADNQACMYHTGTTRKVKPQVIYNHNGFFDSLITLYSTSNVREYIKDEHMTLLITIAFAQNIITELERNLKT